MNHPIVNLIIDHIQSSITSTLWHFHVIFPRVTGPQVDYLIITELCYYSYYISQ